MTYNDLINQRDDKPPSIIACAGIDRLLLCSYVDGQWSDKHIPATDGIRLPFHHRQRHVFTLCHIHFHCDSFYDTVVKANIKVISSDTHQLQCIKQHHCKV